ncbi:MAG: Fis family transcriptional regulator [Thermofilum sp. ex4484_79]|nr:MAG: Fis family transcriptional regulator [Thermofilum sp. ex4484_79]
MPNITRAIHILYGLLSKKPLALCDAGDLDGIGSATLFKIKYPNGIIILAYPNEIKKNFLLRKIYWDFVADLPCPGKAKIRVDHHETNTPCAEKEFFDPKAPASTVLALKALGLEDNEQAKLIAKYAVETDTANVVSDEARMLDAAVKGSNYKDRVYLAEKLASIGLKVFEDPKIRKSIEKYREVRRMTEEIAEKIPIAKEIIIVFTKDLGLSYRYLSILLERKGAEFTFIIVPKKYFVIRIYAGAKPNSNYDSSLIATKLGGGGHQYAAGATIRSLRRKNEVHKILNLIKSFLNKNYLDVLIINKNFNIERRVF